MTIIFLNGCTSAGKSSVASALQAQLDKPYLVSGIDVAFAMIPAHYHNHPSGFIFDRDDRGLVRLNVGEVGLTALIAHQVAAAAIARSGVDLILDEVVFSADLRSGWQKQLDGLDVFAVALHCELSILEEREKARGDRVIGQARGQFDHVHQDITYDLELSTDSQSPEQTAEQILRAKSEW